jgi:multisubunit Na+/H+ antiporter MnhE subunit
VEFVAWWCVAVGVWIASLSAWSTHDFVVAAGCALPCAAAALAARRAVDAAWHPPLATLRWLALLPVGVVRDTAFVLSLPLRRRVPTELRAVDVGAPGDSPAAAGRRAVAVTVLNATPGTVVYGSDPERGTVLVHAVRGPSRTERTAAR